MGSMSHLRTLSWSTWLGWQVESNWANPWLFTLYLVVKPVTGSLMLVCMFYAADAAADSAFGRGVPKEFLPYVYVSNACYALVGAVMFGMSSVVIADRESYRMLKFIFISPAEFATYFFGRGFAKAMEGIGGGVITILAGLALPGIRDSLGFGHLSIGWLIAFLGVGFVMLWSAGMLLASAVLNMNRSSMFLSEGIAGVVYFLSGVVFPLAILPGWLKPVSLALPTTYWLEGMRRAILGAPPPESALGQSPLAGWSTGELFLATLASTAALATAAHLFHRWAVRRAWRNGKIEETTGM
ncbi:MAG: ABC transporter permease [Gemmataceae bacterium]|nr:ABC transporter permease [Gemmataceae bacterium]